MKWVEVRRHDWQQIFVKQMISLIPVRQLPYPADQPRQLGARTTLFYLSPIVSSSIAGLET
jgi:hypothetical protein